jgi:hypothetical protein
VAEAGGWRKLWKVGRMVANKVKVGDAVADRVCRLGQNEVSPALDNDLNSQL